MSLVVRLPPFVEEDCLRSGKAQMRGLYEYETQLLPIIVFLPHHFLRHCTLPQAIR